MNTTTKKWKAVVICMLQEDGNLITYWGGNIENYIHNFSLGSYLEVGYFGYRDEIVTVDLNDVDGFVQYMLETAKPNSKHLGRIKPCKLHQLRRKITDEINFINKKDHVVYDAQVILYCMKTNKIYSSHLHHENIFVELPRLIK